jgi:hypothetical protein
LLLFGNPTLSCPCIAGVGCSYEAGQWTRQARTFQFPNMATVDVSAIDPDVTNELWLTGVN